MSKSRLEIARSYIKRGKYQKAIIVLENAREVYRNSFEYYLLFGIAELYAGVPGYAKTYFAEARKIKINSVDLNLGLAAVYLFEDRIDRSVNYYLDVLHLDPENRQAAAALEFIKKDGKRESVLTMFDTGKIRKFFPQVKCGGGKTAGVILAALAGAVLGLLLFFNLRNSMELGSRLQNYSDVVLSKEEKKSPQQADLSSSSFKYIFSDKAIVQIYEKAVSYFNDYRDNMAQIEVNRLLNSNASTAIKKKALLLESYFEKKDFDSLTDNFEYSLVEKEPELFRNCWVVWSGKIANVQVENESFFCDLLVGDDNLEKLEGVVPVTFSTVPQIEGGRPVKILGKVEVTDGKILLSGRSVYQPLRKSK